MTPNQTPLLVFLHGVGGSPQSFQEQVAKLPVGVEAVCPWLRGARPGSDVTGFSISAAAGEVAATIELSGRRPVWVCGVSAGAMVALDLAVERPDLIDALILASGQVAPPPAVMKAQRVVMKLMPRRVYAAQGVSKARVLTAADEFAKADYRSLLSDVTARTLVVYGSKDRANLGAAHTLADGIPGARLEIVEGAGHEVNVDQPAEFNRLLYGFLMPDGPGGVLPSSPPGAAAPR